MARRRRRTRRRLALRGLEALVVSAAAVTPRAEFRAALRARLTGEAERSPLP